MLDGAVHNRLDWQQGVMRRSDNRDNAFGKLVEPIPDHSNENRSTRKVTVAMDEERLDDHPRVRNEQEGVHCIRAEFLPQ